MYQTNFFFHVLNETLVNNLRGLSLALLLQKGVALTKLIFIMEESLRFSSITLSSSEVKAVINAINKESNLLVSGEHELKVVLFSCDDAEETGCYTHLRTR